MISLIGIKGVFMKKRLLSILLGLIVVLGIVGCSFEPEPEDFVGEWRGIMLMTLNIYADYTWTYGQSVWVFERGTWIHNGDNTITLIREDGSESIAKKKYDRESESSYLLWEEDEYYKVE